MVLDVEDLTVADETGRVWVNEMSFQVRAGEILGLAGVQGNGQTELCEALLGLRPIASGHIRLDGRDLTHSTPRQRLHAGVAYIPEDRQEDGLVGAFSVADNMVLDSYDRPPFASGINLHLGAIASNAAERVEEFDVRTQSADTPVGTLSGGNQQKVILARELGREHKVLVASQPTRGLDVGSIEFVHRRIVQQRDHGVAVLIVSSELDEIYALADRIAVMYEGRITGFRPPSVPVEELGLLMAGSEAPGTPEAARNPGSRDTGSGAGRSGRELMSEQAPPGPPEPPGSPGPATATKQKEKSGESRRSFGQILRESILEGNSVTVIFLAIFTAIVIGGLLNAFTNTTVLHAWGNFFSAPGAAISQAWNTAIGAYVALFEGSIFNPHTVAALFQQASIGTAMHNGYLAAVFNPLSETCVQATPLLLAGLAVALPYQAGMFNIGAQSQFIGGAILATYLGYGVSLPPVVHVIVCVLGGFVGGAVLGWVVGELKARTGAHEVITTIMLNYIMAYLLSYLLGNVMQRPGRSDLISPFIAGDAHLPHLFGSTLRINAGFLLALACAFGVWWLLYRTTTGFEFRAIGKNPSAARVAGMNVERSWVLVMLIAGGLAGLAASTVIQGTDFSLNFQSYGTYGYRRDHGRAARPGPTARGGARGAAVRRAARRRPADAGPDLHPGGHRGGAAGADRAVRGGAAADPGHIPAARGPGRGRRGPDREGAGMTITERVPVVKAEAAPVSPWRRWLAPATFAVFGLVDIFVFGLFAHHGDVTFAFSQPFSKVTIPDLSLPAAETCYACGALTLVLAALRAVLKLSTLWRRVSIAVVVFLFVLALLCWAGPARLPRSTW